MTKEELIDSYDVNTLKTCKQLLEDYAEYLEENELFAINSIDNLKQSAKEIPSDFDEL